MSERCPTCGSEKRKRWNIVACTCDPNANEAHKPQCWCSDPWHTSVPPAPYCYEHGPGCMGNRQDCILTMPADVILPTPPATPCPECNRPTVHTVTVSGTCLGFCNTCKQPFVGAPAAQETAERWFRLQNDVGDKVKPGPLRVPWSVAEKAYSVYSKRYGNDQSLERLNERGGFSLGEMDMFYPQWREEVGEIASLRAEIVRLKESLDILGERGDLEKMRADIAEEKVAQSQELIKALQRERDYVWDAKWKSSQRRVVRLEKELDELNGCLVFEQDHRLKLEARIRELEGGK